LKLNTNELQKNLKEAFQSLRNALLNYHLALNKLINERSIPYKRFRESANRTLDAYKKAETILISVSLEIYDKATDRVVNEFENKKWIIETATRISQASSGSVQSFAASIVALASAYIAFFGAIHSQIHKKIFFENTLPPILESFKIKQKRARLWLIPSVISLLVSFFGFPPLMTIVIASIGVLMFLIDKFYLVGKYYPGADLPGRLAHEAAIELPKLQERIESVDKLVSYTDVFSLDWPPKFTDILKKLDKHTAVDASILQLLTDFAIDLYKSISEIAKILIKNGPQKK
jgi:hypothetical protein